MISPETARARFAEVFGRPPQCVAFAPGRVNLIGEHIDYAGGTVLPMAIEQGVTVAMHLLPAGYELQSGHPEAKKHAESAQSLVAACARQMANMPGCEVYIESDLPVSMGLSSSAAFCVATLAAMSAIPGRKPPDSALHLAQMAQQAETSATGTKCGLMDQYASVFGRKGCAMLFNTHSVSHVNIPIELVGCGFVAINSGQARQLGESGYNERRRELECEMAEIRESKDWDGSLSNFPDIRLLDELPPPRERGPVRLKHVVSEQHRVEEFTFALRRKDVEKLGSLLNESHASLAENYEVSTDEIDTLVSLLTGTECVKGARIMGGGFGGAVLALVDLSSAPAILDKVLAAYREQTGLNGSWQMMQSADGARVWLCDKSEHYVSELLS